MLHSILAAAFGVQSGKHRARDFAHGKASHFIALGGLFTLVFIAVLIGLVQLALHLTRYPVPASSRVNPLLRRPVPNHRPVSITDPLSNPRCVSIPW